MTSSRGAGGVLAHYIPRAALGDARELAMQMRRDEFVRAYAAGHWWLIVPAGMIFMLLSGACTGAVVTLALLFTATSLPWFAHAVLFAAPVLWIAGVILQVHVLFSWLERRALAAMPSARSARPESAAWLKVPSLVLAVLIALVAFVLVMLVPEAALLFLGLGLLIPIVITLFDR